MDMRKVYTKQNKSNKLKKPLKKQRPRKIKASSNRRPVDNWVHFKATGNADGNVRIDFSDDGRLKCPEAEVSSIVSYRSYERQSGKQKIITQSPGTYFNQRRNIENNFDAIAGIDTNDFQLEDGRRISISSSFCSQAMLKTSPQSLMCDATPAFIIDSVRNDLNPEVVGWHLFLTHILPLLPISNGERLALVVDSELDQHISLNQREKPYYRDHYLPPNVSLLYASSDTGSDLTNQLIKECDKLSRWLFAQIQSGDLKLGSVLGGATPDFAGYAYVNIEGSPYYLEIGSNTDITDGA